MQLAHKEFRAKSVKKDHKGKLDRKVSKEKREIQEQLEQMELTVQPDLKVRLDHRESRAKQGPKEKLVLKDHKVRSARKEKLDPRVKKEIQVKSAHED